MIKKTLRRKLSKYLKGSFLEDIVTVLNENEVVSKLGKPYTKQYISHVFNGRYENINIENAILLTYKKRKEQSILIEKAREELLR